MKRRIMLTVDTEAIPRRALSNHVSQLIHGNVSGQEVGIGLMMDIADSHEIKMTFFLEYAQYLIHGDELIDAGRLINNRNHDLQVHLHPTLLPRDYLTSKGLEFENDMFHMSEPQADEVIDYALRCHEMTGAKPPIAFRGGGYRYNSNILNSLNKRGVFIVSNYNPRKSNQPYNVGSKKQFRWDNGCLEIPISCVDGFRGRQGSIPYNFNSGLFNNPRHDIDRTLKIHEDFIDQFFEKHGEDSILMLVMHSWSFLELDDDGFRSIPSEHSIELFSKLLEKLKESMQFITAIDVFDSGELNNEDIEVIPIKVLRDGNGR